MRRILKDEYDVVVVGAGPGGSMASYYASKNGAKTLLVEKSQEIGEPVRCAEAVPKLEEFNIPPSEEFVRSHIKGGYLIAPNGKRIEVSGGKTEGYVVERKIFDKYLAIRSAKVGTKIAVKSRVVDLYPYEDGFKVKVIHLGEEYTVKTKIVIAADGVESSVAEMAGLKCKKSPIEVCSCAEYEMTGVKLLDKHMMEFYFGDLSPKGYAWIFPKGDTANVGLGVIDKKKKAIDYLNEFLEHPILEGRLKDATPVEFKFGGVPVGGPIERTVDDNIMVVGDAAGQVSPLTGGGIYLAMSCGSIAGEVAGKSVKKGDYSKETLMEYERRWKERFYNTLMTELKYKNILQRLSEKELNAIAEAIDGKLEEVDVKKIVFKVIKKAPSLLKYFKDIIK
ncbi:digeranylgeranylglycerophospholipid reductase [Methanofervidicoccus sp. A16]|uniref:NAD(P)/FAD-dependent oxidoreductase n=1 Tax=Methanofervidicoccus sp. A16 TaxID=2607662 RepID=UPI001189395F|nr:NAD(P)/FAD-dependent oxidoreductase [Methanofervidicoccus sp. A16]AXI24697.1 digeranylgeranylglycerophospholipid reductase [Methanofervidicoccus sp. A16]